MNIQDWSPLGLTGLIFLLSKGLSRISSAPQLESIYSSVLSLLYGPILTYVHDYQKNHSFDYTDLCRQSYVYAFYYVNFVINFLPRSKSLWISWLKSVPIMILEPKKINSFSVSTFSPSICHEVMGPDAMNLVLWMMSFKPTFFVSSLTLIQRFLVPLCYFAIRVASSAYLQLLIFLLAILIPACDSSRLTFNMMYTACKLPKQDGNIQPWHTSLPI